MFLFLPYSVKDSHGVVRCERIDPNYEICVRLPLQKYKVLSLDAQPRSHSIKLELKDNFNVYVYFDYFQ